MKNISILLWGLLISLNGAGATGAVTWVEDSYEDFADGRFDAAGQNIYVTRDGHIRTIHHFDLNQDGHIDLIFNSTHDSYAFIPASVASVAPDRQIVRGKLAVEGSQHVEIADLNRDGYLDVVFCPNSSGIQHSRRFLTILWGGEDGWPSHRSNGALPTYGAGDIAITDLNHDEWPDIAVLCDEAWTIGQPSGRIIRIFWGGKRGFMLMRQQDIGVAKAIDLAARDFDNDGAADLAVLTSDQQVHVVWSTASKSKPVEFKRTNITLPNNESRCITIASCNKDRHVDLVIGTNTGKVNIVPGASGRKWSKVVTLNAYDASHVAVGDLDADSHQDLVLTELAITHALGGEAGAAHAEDEANVRVLWGNENGYDVSRSTHLHVPYAAATAIGDLDGDGKLDLAVAVHQGNETYESESAIFFGQDNRQFERGNQSIPTEGATDVAIAAANGSLPPRVVFCNANGGTLDEKVPPLVYWGGPNGFGPERVWKVPVNSGYEATATDLNADGFVDLLAMNSGHVGDIAEADPHLGANIFWGSAEGFQEANRSTLREHGLGASNVADLNHDGYLDVVLGAFEHGEPEVLVIYYGSAAGLKRSGRVALPCARRSTGCIIADYNHDDWLDIAVSSYPDHLLRIFWGSPQGFAADHLSQLDIPSPIGLEAADLNADGYLDLIGGSYTDAIDKHHDTGTFIFWGSDQGFLNWNAQWLPGMTPIGYVVADFDADGFLDLFSPHYHSELTREALPCYLYWGSAAGFTPRNKTILICDSAHDGIAADFDRDGRLDLAVSCHTRDGDHHTNSRIFYNDGNRFAHPQIDYLPTHGTHWMYVQDMGHIYHRKWEQTYESSVYQWDTAISNGQIAYKAYEPEGTRLRFEVRTADNQNQIVQANWRELTSNRFTLQATARYLQYRATFQSDNGDRYPVLDRVTVNLISTP